MGAAILTAAALVLAACADPTGPGGLPGETILQGKGLVHIRLSAGAPAQSVRTTVPEGITAYYYSLKFTAPGKTPVEVEDDGASLSFTVPLDPVTWTLEVKGYTDNNKTTLKVTGNLASIPVTPGTEQSFEVYLTPNFSSGGTGSLSYSIAFPAGVRAWLGLYPMDDTPGTSQEVDISASAGGAATGALSSLPEGSYRVAIELYDAAANTALAWTGAAHIYGGLVTTLSHAFAGTDFVACPPVAGDGTSTLAAKLNAALASSPGSYTIVLDGAETDLASFTPKTLNVTGSKGISIAIRGNGTTVQVDRIGSSLFTLGADTGSSLSLALHDITLAGKSGNSVPVAQVNSGGTLSMKAGSLITGNTSSSSGGGGVYVNRGTLTMSGGAVSGNTSSSSCWKK